MRKTRAKKLSRQELSRYAGEWVVFVGSRIVAHDKTLASAMAKVEKGGLDKKAAVFRVPRRDEGPYVLIIL